MSAKILVHIPCFNRRRILERCVPTVRAGLEKEDVMWLWNDGSNEYDDWWLRQFADDVFHPSTESGQKITHTIGVERQRREHFLNFIYRQEDFTHLYLTDSDALHDPGWRAKALDLQEKAGGAPVCLYDTEAHEQLVGNTIERDEAKGIIWRRVAPGISYFLTHDQAYKIFEYLCHYRGDWNWDWAVPSILGNRFAISMKSYVDHIGLDGLHHPKGEGLGGGDRALNPTDWLIDKRREVVKILSHDRRSPLDKLAPP